MTHLSWRRDELIDSHDLEGQWHGLLIYGTAWVTLKDSVCVKKGTWFVQHSRRGKRWLQEADG